MLTGIRLMRSGEVEANVARLNDDFRMPYVDDLIARKVSGAEQQTIEAADAQFFRGEYERLRAMLKIEAERTSLPDTPTSRAALHDLLLRLRGV